MAFFYPSKLKSFLAKHDLNTMLQEICSALIGIFAGLYAYEKRTEFFGLLGVEGGEDFSFSFPPNWLEAQNRTIFITCLCIFGIVIFFKILLYTHILNLNFQKRKKKNVLDINGIIQEFCTILVGTTFGIFSAPVTQRVFLGLFEKSEYPNPVPAIIIIGICFFLKLLLYSEALNFNADRKSSVIYIGALGIFFKKADWNGPIKDFLSTLIGVGIGLYLYHSNLIFWPEQKLGKAWGVITGVGNKAANEGLKQSKEGRTILKFFGLATGQNTKKEMKIVPKSFSEKEKRPYWIIGIAMVAISAIMKLFMYLGVINFNAIRNFLFRVKKKKIPLGRDINGIIDEFIMLALSIILGTLASPILDNLTGTPAEYPYGGLGLMLLMFLLLIKICFVLEIINFNKEQKVPKRKKKLKRKVARKRR